MIDMTLDNSLKKIDIFLIVYLNRKCKVVSQPKPVIIFSL